MIEEPALSTIRRTPSWQLLQDGGPDLVTRYLDVSGAQ
jgi:hypothetical protein